MEYSDIYQSILESNLNRQQLGEINELIIRLDRELMAQKARTFRVGQTVQFTTKYGVTYKGKVERINRKSVSVIDCLEYDNRTHEAVSLVPCNFRVSPSLLEAV